MNTNFYGPDEDGFLEWLENNGYEDASDDDKAYLSGYYQAILDEYECDDE